MTKEMKYIWVLDFTDGEVYKYNINNKWWNPDNESIEDFLINQNHKIDDIEWMVTKNKEINK